MQNPLSRMNPYLEGFWDSRHAMLIVYANIIA